MVRKISWNAKGLTLVEVLATLVLLGVIFIGIMGVFSQMSLFNEKTYTKLDTMNLARQEINEIKGIQYPLAADKIVEKFKENNYLIDSTYTKKDQNGHTIYLLTKSKNGYIYELRFYENPKLVGKANVETLYQVHLMVKTGNKLNSETYAYIESK